jgi:hypothetical protein
MSDTCKKCGGLREQHDAYAYAIGVKSIYVWELGFDLPVVDCPKFEPKDRKESQ